MSAELAPLAGLFALMQERFAHFQADLALNGIAVDPAMELRKGEGMLCYFDRTDGHIYLSFPTPEDPLAPLQVIFYRELLGFASTEEFATFLRAMLPLVLAHEFGHCLRHHYRQFGENVWHEEQVANHFANALMKARLSPAERDNLVAAFRHAVTRLEELMKARGVALDIFHNPLLALAATGRLGHGSAERLEMLARLCATNLLEMLKTSGVVDAEAVERLGRRENLISEFNAAYTADVMAYMYHQFTWFMLEMRSPERRYLPEVAREHLGLHAALLPAYAAEEKVEEAEIIACAAAARKLATRHATASRHLHKRYRSLLYRRIEAGVPVTPAREEIRRLLENWNEHEEDPLSFFCAVAPVELQRLFPRQIESLLTGAADPGAGLSAETDRRLYRAAAGEAEDNEATATLLRLELLDRAEFFCSLPAENLIELAHRLSRIILQPGEPIIWQGETNNDVFLLVSVALEVVMAEGGKERQVGRIAAGEVFGEMAFFTCEPRSATVRATEPSACFVLRAIELRLLALRYPEVMMHLARPLAQRLDRVQRGLKVGRELSFSHGTDKNLSVT